MKFLLISSLLAAGVSSLRLTPRRHTRLHTSSSGPLSFKTHVELEEACPVTMGGDLGDRRCIMMRWKRDENGAASDVKYEMFTSYGPRADRFEREWKAAGYEVVFLGLLRIPGVGELMPVVSRDTMARLPDFQDDHYLQLPIPKDTVTMARFCGFVEDGEAVAAEASRNFAALTEDRTSRGWVAMSFALARMPENALARFNQEWFIQEALAVCRAEEIFGHEAFCKSLEKGFWDGGFRLSDPPPTKYYIKNAASDEKDASKSGLSKAPRVEATASFEATAPRVVTETIIKSIEGGLLSHSDACSAAVAIAPAFVSNEVSKALLAHESESEAQQGGFLSRLSAFATSWLGKSAEQVKAEARASAISEVCDWPIYELSGGNLLSHVDTTTEVAPVEIKVCAADDCRFSIQMYKAHEKAGLVEMHLFKSIDDEGRIVAYAPGSEIVVMTTTKALSTSARDHSLMNRGFTVEEFPTMPSFDDEELQQRYETGKRIIKVLANKDLPKDLPDDRGELKDLLTQCGFVIIPNDTESMKRYLKNASKDTFYQLRYGMGGRNSYSWIPSRFDPETMKEIRVEWIRDMAKEQPRDFIEYKCKNDNLVDRAHLLAAARQLVTPDMVCTMEKLNETCIGKPREAHNVEAVLPIVKILDDSSEVTLIPSNDQSEGKWHLRCGAGPYTAPYCTSLVSTSGSDLVITSLIDSTHEVNVPDHAYAGHIALVRPEIAARVLGERYRKRFFVVMESTHEYWGGNAMPMEVRIPVDDARRFLDGKKSYQALDAAYYSDRRRDPKNRYKIEALRVAGFCKEEDLPKRIKELTIKWGRWWLENKKVLAPVSPDPWVKCNNKIYENTAAIGKRVRVRYPSDDEGRSGAWYNGVITAFNDGKHTILFDVDGKPDDLKLSDETFRIRAAP